MFHSAPAATAKLGNRLRDRAERSERELYERPSGLPGIFPYGRMEMQSIWLTISVSTHLHLDSCTPVKFHNDGKPCHPMRMLLI